MRVAEAEMLGALRLMTIERGVDPRGFALLAFGGAGPLHAAALADQLGISRVLCPRASGVLSRARPGRGRAAPRRRPHGLICGARDPQTSGTASARALLERAAEALGGDPVRVRVRHELRYGGQSFELPVDEERIGASARRSRTRRASAPSSCGRPSHARTSGATDTAKSRPSSSW